MRDVCRVVSFAIDIFHLFSLLHCRFCHFHSPFLRYVIIDITTPDFFFFCFRRVGCCSFLHCLMILRCHIFLHFLHAFSFLLPTCHFIIVAKTYMHYMFTIRFSAFLRLYSPPFSGFLLPAFYMPFCLYYIFVALDAVDDAAIIIFLFAEPLLMLTYAGVEGCPCHPFRHAAAAPPRHIFQPFAEPRPSPAMRVS